MPVRHQLPNGPSFVTLKSAVCLRSPAIPPHLSQFTLQSGDSGQTGLLTNVELTALFAFRYQSWQGRPQRLALAPFTSMHMNAARAKIRFIDSRKRPFEENYL
jgi:hypothetical protein